MQTVDIWFCKRPLFQQRHNLHVSNTEILSRFEIGHCSGSTEHPQPSKGETVEQELRRDKEILLSSICNSIPVLITILKFFKLFPEWAQIPAIPYN